MKKMLMVLFIAVLYNSTVLAQTKNIETLKGTWLAVDSDNNDGGLEVVDKQKLFLVYGDKKKEIIEYKADFTKTPVWFDFTVKDGEDKIPLKSLMQFISNDLIQWQVFIKAERTEHFTADAGEIIYLRRMK